MGLKETERHNRPVVSLAEGGKAREDACPLDGSKSDAPHGSLCEDEERLRFALEAGRIGTWDLDLVDHTAHRSLEHDRIFGYEQMLPRWTYEVFLEHVLPEDRAAVDGKFRRAVATGDDWSFECRIRRADGEVRWIRAAGRYRRDAAGGMSRMAGIVQDITERKQAEEALRESEELVRTIAENSTQALVMMDERGYCSYVNQACLEMTGYTADEIRSKPLHDLVHHHYPDGRPYPIEECPLDRALLENFDVRAHEDLFFRKDGTAFPVLCAASPIVKEGRPVATVIEVRDITEQKRAEEALRKSEERQAFLLRLSDTLRPLADPADVQYQAARLLGEHLGASRVGYAEAQDDGETIVVARTYTNGVPDIEGRYRYDDYGPELLREFRAGRTVVRDDIAGDPTLTDAEKAAHAALQLGATVNVPLMKAGRLVAVLFMHHREAHAWSADEVGLLEAVAERTWAAVERARTEEALHQAVERYKQQDRLFDGVASTTPDFVYLFDLHGRFLYANRRLLEVWGMQLPDVIGKTPRELGYEQWHHDMHMREIAEVIETKRPIKGEVPFKAPRTGIFGVYEYIFTPVIGPDGEVELIAGTTRDVTERNRAEEALRETNARMAEADRRKDEFLAMLGHELRNPLAAISSAIHLMGLRGLDDPALERARAAAERQSAHMARLVDDLLDVSRVTQGKVMLRQEEVAVTDVVESAVEGAHPVIEAAGHRLYLSLPREALCVIGDPVRLAQAVGNLLNNAAKYTPPGGEIHLTVERQDGEAAIRVRDGGVGIPPELLPRIFDLFVQGERGPDRAQGGLGIGLTMVKRLVELHGGRVEAASPGVGKGSEFAIVLPLAPGFKAQAGEAAAGSPEPRALTTPRRILVVDDNADAAELLAMLLEDEGHEVVAAYGGPAALDLAASYQPDTVLLDIGMPGMDGYEVASRLREQPALTGVLIVALTGYGQDEDRERSRRAGLDAHLVKPVNLDALRAVLAGEGERG